MNEEAMRLGSLLKAKRKELHLSLKEVENSTSIRSSYLDAIEEGRIYECIAGIYALGFIKQYGIFLGFDMQHMAEELPSAFATVAEKHDFSYGIGTLEVRGSLGGGVKWLPNLLWAGVSVVVLLLAWYFAKFIHII